MCSGLKFQFAATIFELKRSYKYISFIERLTFDSAFISNYGYCNVKQYILTFVYLIVYMTDWQIPVFLV